MTRDHKLALVRSAVISADPDAMEAAAALLADMATLPPEQSTVVLQSCTPRQRITIFAVWTFQGHRRTRARMVRLRQVERWAGEIAETGALSYATRWQREGDDQ